MRIFVHGNDVIGWSIDHDRKHLEAFIRETGHTVTRNILAADIVQSVLWNQLLENRYFPLRFKKIFATASNFITPENPSFAEARKFVDLWIAPSRRQFEVFREAGVKAAYQPFYIDAQTFRSIGKSRHELSCMLGIDPEIVKDKILIGSFQRDTLGADLTSPKWQKGPEMLIEILSAIPEKDRYLLVLTGPRRHYVVGECERKGVPYLFFGNKPVAGVDDIGTGIRDLYTMALLYNLVDCYIVTSRSEGGPKGVIESAFCKTMIFSMRVGLADDVIEEECLSSEKNGLAEKLIDFVQSGDPDRYRGIVEKNYRKSMVLCSREATSRRWQLIFESHTADCEA
jgi:glycosyltransferase involved in cell wall biosynthesis